MRCLTSSHGAATVRRRRPCRRRPYRSCASSQRPIAPVTTVCASSPRRSTVERHDLLALMAKLKLAGMRAAYDDVTRDGLKRQRSVQQILGDLLSAEVAEKEARSISYQIGAAKLPLAKELSEFKFTGSPVNETLVRTCTAADSSRHSAMSYSSAGPAPAKATCRLPSPPIAYASAARGRASSTSSTWSTVWRPRLAPVSPAGWPSNSPALIWWCSTNSAICLSPSRAASCCST